MQEYEDDRWRIIAAKVGNGFSAAACKDKATDLGDEGDHGEGGNEDPGPGPGPSTPRAGEAE